MSTNLRADLLHALCQRLPEADAALIARMPTDDLMTYVEAYAAARRCHVHLPRELRREFVGGLIDEIEADMMPGRESLGA